MIEEIIENGEEMLSSLIDIISNLEGGFSEFMSSENYEALASFTQNSESFVNDASFVDAALSADNHDLTDALIEPSEGKVTQSNVDETSKPEPYKSEYDRYLEMRSGAAVPVPITIGAGIAGLYATVKAIYDSKKSAMGSRGSTKCASDLHNPLKREKSQLFASQAMTDEEKVKSSMIWHIRQRRSLIQDAEPYKIQTYENAKKITGLLNHIDYVRGVILRNVLATMIEYENQVEGALYIALDVPISDKADWNNYTRIRKYKGDDKLYFYHISEGHRYALEPMYPRFACEVDGKIIFKEMTQEMRELAMKKMRPFLQTKPSKFTNAELKLIHAYLECRQEVQGNKHKTHEDLTDCIRKRMRPNNPQNQQYINELWSRIAIRGFMLFMGFFPKKKLVVDYWHEMGLCFDKPE